MIQRQQIKEILKGYNSSAITIGVLGGHSALDVCRGAKDLGFKTLAVCQRGREKTYASYYKTRREKGIVDEIILVDHFRDITKPAVQEKLRKLNTVFIHNRYFWVYCNFQDIENTFLVPIYGTRTLLKLEERDVPKNQYYLLEKSGIRYPKLFAQVKDIDRLVIVKVAEAQRGYERSFFFAHTPEEYEQRAKELLAKGQITQDGLAKAVIEEYIVGVQVNFNFFYTTLHDELELMGIDTRRQTNLDGLIRLPAPEQLEVLKHLTPKYIEAGHIACTIKESLLEQAFIVGEKFIKTCKKEHPPGIIGPFALQACITAGPPKEEIVVFDVSLRIPGSPGTMFTPYTQYLYGQSLSYGKRIAMEIKEARDTGKLLDVLT
ncbi:formate--phosphoribosylaminoimidazolecarboxamide ligase family protein [Candidatus Woesearchaeota archaeon]|nr:formate--phosphoribosylaminoimidazolecarboxamide ligase family protein [Candidatus Woesearchaeota archaeon]